MTVIIPFTLYIYVCLISDKNSVVLQEGETIDYKWVDKETFEKIDENELAARRTLEPLGNIICR